MKLLLIGNSDIEHDIFKLALTRLNLGVEFFGVKSCKAALANLLEKLLPTPDYIILDTDTEENSDSCLRMLKGSPAVGWSKIILYSSSKETAAIHAMMQQGAESHIFKSYSFTAFCQDLSNLLAEPNSHSETH